MVKIYVRKIKFNIPLIDQSHPKGQAGEDGWVVNQSPSCVLFLFIFNLQHTCSDSFSGRMFLFSETCKSETEQFNHNLKDIFGWCMMTVLWSKWTTA